MKLDASQQRVYTSASERFPSSVVHTHIPQDLPPTLGGPPRYQRTPRKHIILPQKEVEIQAPPSPPTQPSSTVASLLLPLSGTVISVILSVVLALAAPVTTGASLLGLVMTVPMLVGSVGLGVYNYRQERKRYQQEIANREQNYHSYLGKCYRMLESLRQAQLNASLIPNPSLHECQQRAERCDPEKRLWDRSPDDEDFLDLRLGIGSIPASFSVKPPSQPQGGGACDDLLDNALSLAWAYTHVDGAAVTLPLAKVVSAGVAGDRDALNSCILAMLMQLATHHAPSEVKIVLIFPEQEMDIWTWARWLPHVWNEERSYRFIATSPSMVRSVFSELYDILKQRELQRSDDKSVAPATFSPVFVFIFADSTLLSGPEVGNLAPLLRLLTGGANIGAYALFLYEQPDQVRKECGAIVHITQSDSNLHIVGPPPLDLAFRPDGATVKQAELLARTLAPLRLERLGSVVHLPKMVPLFDLFGVTKVEDLPVKHNWQESQPFKSLAVPVGRRAGNDLVLLDLHERGHGPNGLIAGTVGSGKSELIQTLILSLAIHFPPSDVVFVLLDFKGGGMAFPVKDLPHVVNTITNLEMELVGRALTSLEAELERREQLFKRAGVTHIDDYIKLYRQSKVSENLPYLVLIVDEFTVLKDKQPDDMRRFVMVAVKGRSLGFRMILATQKPHGVISDQIDANSRFRLCLRVARPEDSTDMIKRPDAASLTGVGRTFFRVGEDEIFELYQTAWSGAPYQPDSGASEDLQGIAEVLLNGQRRSLQPVIKDVETTKKQIGVLIQHLQYLANQEGIKDLPKVWMPPLPLEIPLEQIRPIVGWDGKTWQRSRFWLAPIIGLVDDPSHQRQEALRLDLGKEGHLAVYGAPGTGKTTLLQTLVLSLILSHSPQEVNLYLLDFGNRILKLFDSLPHVGGVVLPEEIERLQRLVKFLQRELDHRKILLQQAGVSTLSAYRLQGDDVPPAIVVIVDNYAELALNYPDLAEALTALIREGGNLGLHFILTATMPSVIPARVSGNFALSVALELHDPGDYSLVVGRTHGLVPAHGIRGRGLVRDTLPLEFQTALPVAGDTEGKRSAAMIQLFSEMKKAWSGLQSRPIPVLPTVVPLCDLLPPEKMESLPTTSLSVPVGLDAETLETFYIDLVKSASFLITGPPGSGKTTFLQSWVLALTECLSPERLELYLVDMGSTNLLLFSSFPHVQAYVENDECFGSVLDKLRLKLNDRRQVLDKNRRAAGGLLDESAFRTELPALVLVLDNFDQFNLQASDGHKNVLEDLLRQRGLGFHVLISSPINEFTSTWDGLGKTIKSAQTGILLGTTDHNDLSLFNFHLPAGESGKVLSPGVGYYVQRGRYKFIKGATIHEGAMSLTRWVERIQNKSMP